MSRHKQTHCHLGHEMTLPNSIWTQGRSGKPKRHCRACRNLRYRFRYRHDDAFRQKQIEKSALQKQKQRLREMTVEGHA